MSEQPRMRVVYLGSGSSGNAAAITFGETVILIDCGFSAREVTQRLERAGLAARDVSAVFVTHEHSDHTKGLDVFVRRDAPGCVVYASQGTRHAARLDKLSTEVRTCAPGECVSVGAVEVVAFRTSHDAAEPTGFRIAAGDEVLGHATDTGVLSDEALEALAGATVLGLESNHDVRMLETGPYPWVLKRRISSETGHLSNADAADALERLAHDGLKRVFALHRSRTNNTAELAGTALADRLARIGLEVPVQVPAQNSVCDPTPVQRPLFTSK